MPRVSKLFFLVAVVCGIIGILWGIQMAESQDHLQMPAHAHLNLLGWVSGAIYGIYFALHAGRFQRTSWAVFALNTAGVATMIPNLALFYASSMQATQYLLPIQIGTGLILAAMVVFATAVVRDLISKS